MSKGRKFPKLRRLAATFTIAAAGLMFTSNTGCTSMHDHGLPEDWAGAVAAPLILPDSLAPLEALRIKRPNNKIMISYGQILQDQRVQRYAALDTRPNYHFDLNAGDEFSTTIARIQAEAIEHIASSPEFRRLLNKTYWDMDDRMDWEDALSTLISDKINDIDGWDNYRTGEFTRTDDEPYRDPYLNNLSSDMTNDTEELEFDCEAMSIVEGILIQRIEQHFLPVISDADNKKFCGNYFYTAGRRIDAKDTEIGPTGHAYIVSGVTGNVIEAVKDPDKSSTSPYQRAVNHDYSFQTFLDGTPLITKDGTAFGLSPSIDEVNIARRNSETTHVANTSRAAPNRSPG